MLLNIYSKCTNFALFSSFVLSSYRPIVLSFYRSFVLSSYRQHPKHLLQTLLLLLHNKHSKFIINSKIKNLTPDIMFLLPLHKPLVLIYRYSTYNKFHLFNFLLTHNLIKFNQDCLEFFIYIIQYIPLSFFQTCPYPAIPKTKKNRQIIAMNRGFIKFFIRI